MENNEQEGQIVHQQEVFKSIKCFLNTAKHDFHFISTTFVVYRKTSFYERYYGKNDVRNGID